MAEDGMIEFSCPHCGSRHTTNERYLGQQFRCGSCQKLFTITLRNDRFNTQRTSGVLSGKNKLNRVLVLAGVAALLAGACAAAYYVGAHRGASGPNSGAAVNLSSGDIDAPNSPTARTPTSTLQDASASGLVVADFSGNGGSSGDSVRVQLSKGSKSSPGLVEEVLPIGSILTSRDEGAQSMVVAGVRGVELGGGKFRPESRIVLTDGETVTYVLSAYCIQFEKQNPSNSTGFSLERPDPALACIARKGTMLTVPAMQAAVWMQSDQITYAHMTEKFSITEQDWSAGRAVFQECQDATRARPHGAN